MCFLNHGVTIHLLAHPDLVLSFRLCHWLYAFILPVLWPALYNSSIFPGLSPFSVQALYVF